jgi:hypothetical protein
VTVEAQTPDRVGITFECEITMHCGPQARAINRQDDLLDFPAHHHQVDRCKACTAAYGGNIELRRNLDAETRITCCQVGIESVDLGRLDVITGRQLYHTRFDSGECTRAIRSKLLQTCNFEDDTLPVVGFVLQLPWLEQQRSTGHKQRADETEAHCNNQCVGDSVARPSNLCR